MKIDRKLSTDIILNTAILYILLLGLYTRFYFMKNEICYNGDDIMLMSSVSKYGYLYLITKPLDTLQISPPLYTIMLKFLYSFFGMNYRILVGGGSFVCSCMALILMPIVTYKICRNKFAALIALTIMAFHTNIIYYTLRLKHYSADIFLTILLIFLGCIFFSKPVTKKKMLLLTIILINCCLFSFTSNIITACLIFYYIFLFEKDNIKTKIINFSIFITFWLMTFGIYMQYVGIHAVGSHNNESIWGISATFNFVQFKETILYLFGNKFDNLFYHEPTLTISNHFWYLFIPVVISSLIILVKKDRYLFSILILPILTSYLLKVMNIYPFSAERTSLWMCPIFIILFVFPTIYIKFNKKIFFLLLSSVLIIYYLSIYNKTSFNSVKNLFNGYSYSLSNLLSKSIIKENSRLVFMKWEVNMLNMDDMLYKVVPSGIDDVACTYNILSILSEKADNEYIYFYLYKNINSEKYSKSYDLCYQTIKKNADILYEYETGTRYGDKIIMVK